MQDDAHAVEWLRMAAEQGRADAQYYLALRYAEGSGVPKTHSQVVHWLHMAAEQRHADAQYKMGLMYCTAHDVDDGTILSNLAQAAHWLRMAAEQGHAGAQYYLGLLYAEGRRYATGPYVESRYIPQDDAEAMHWLSIASEQWFRRVRQGRILKRNGEPDQAHTLCTYCSASKSDQPGEIPAIQRYQSSRIRRVSEAAVRLGIGFLILSGKFGLVLPEQPIPLYDHLLQQEEVSDLAALASEQMRANNIGGVVYFTRSLYIDKDLLPYHEVIVAACGRSCIPLHVIDLGDI